MRLSEFLQQERGLATRLAAHLRVDLSQVSQIARDSSSTNPARCVAIEDFTGGAVRRWDLREADWHLIWPELITVKGSPDIPTKEPAHG